MADLNEAGGEGDMVSFTPNALRAMADSIEGRPALTGRKEP